MDVPGENDCFPIDARPLLDRAVAAVAPFALTRAVGIEVRQPDLDSYVLASPHHLQQAFEHVLSFLLGDARKESTATVRVEETAQWVTYSFANTGCGLSDGRFRDYLFGEQPPASEEFQNLRNVVRWVTGWGGTVEAGSSVGEGVFVTVSLPRFG